MRRPILAAGLLLLLPAAASAVTFSGSWQAGGSALADPGLVVAASGAPGFTVALEPGQSIALDLFRLWTAESDVGADDLMPRRLDIALRLDGPVAARGSVVGTTVGHRGLGQHWGSVDWGSPLTLAVGGGSLSVSLDDAVFNAGIGSLRRGHGGGTDVRANFRYVAPVPLPAGLGLVGLAIGTLGLLRGGRWRPGQRGGRKPAARADASSQNQASPRSGSIRVRA